MAFFWCRMPALPLLLLLLLVKTDSASQPSTLYRDSFETPRVSWVQGTADAPFTVQKHDRTDERAREGIRCERFVLLSGRGTQILYHYPKLPRIAVTEGGFVRLWVKANRQGTQLLLRVVLPHEPAGPPSESARLVVIPGPVYERAGKWQLLEVADTARALERQLRLVRAQLGRDVDARGAYIDALTLNLYSGQGLVEVYVDELEASPRIAQDGVVDVQLRGVQTPSPARLEVAGEQIRFEGVPRLPKFVFVSASRAQELPSVAADGILLSQPSPRQLLAQPSGPWLVPLLRMPEPGPTAVMEANLRATVQAMREAPAVVAWAVAGICPPWTGLARLLPETRAEAVEQLRWTVRQLHLEDQDRPVIVAGNASLYRVSRFADVMLIGRNPVGSSFPLADYAEWLEARRVVARPGLPVIGWVPTIPEQPWIEHPATFEQMRLAAYACLIAGCRGIAYDVNRVPADHLHWVARRLELLNAELSLIEPFLAAAGPPERLKSEWIEVEGAGERELAAERQRIRSSLESGRSVARSKLQLGQEFDAAVYRTPRAALVLIAWTAPDSEAVAPQMACQQLRFVVEGVPETALAWSIGPGGVEPLEGRRVAGGMQVTVREFDTACAVVLSTDTRLFQMSRSRAAAVQKIAAQRIVSITRDRISRCRHILAQLDRGATRGEVMALLARAESLLQIAEQRYGQALYPEAFQAAARSLRAVRLAEHTTWQRWHPADYRPGVSPFLLSFDLLPRQRELIAAVARSTTATPTSNLVPEGSFEATEALQQAGWTQRADLPEGLTARAYLVQPPGKGSDGRALRMTVEPAGEQSPQVVFFDGQSGFTLYSGELTASQAGVLLISLVVNIPRALKPRLARFAVYDTLYGEDLAVRLAGPTRGWHRIVLYRPVGRGARLKLAFNLQGAGEVLLDRLSVRFIPFAPAAMARGDRRNNELAGEAELR